MPIRPIDVNQLEECADLPEEPRKKKIIILSVIGAALLITDVAGMAFANLRYGSKKNWPDDLKFISKVLEIGCIASAVLLFVAFKFHRKNKSFYVFLGLWIAYIIWFMVAMTIDIPFF